MSHKPLDVTDYSVRFQWMPAPQGANPLPSQHPFRNYSEMGNQGTEEHRCFVRAAWVMGGLGVSSKVFLGFAVPYQSMPFGRPPEC
jgi:hypothetical protein